MNNISQNPTIAAEDEEAHKETLHILSDPVTLKALQDSEIELQKGEYESFEDVFGHVLDEV